MKTILWLLLLPALAVNAQKKPFSIDALVSFAGFTGDKLATTLTHKGFKLQELPNTSHNTSLYYNATKDKAIKRLIGKYEKGDSAAIVFQTTSESEYKDLKEELNEEGYWQSVTDTSSQAVLYQKGNITIESTIKYEAEKPAYCFAVQRKQLPEASHIVYAEDLLALTSHQYIAAVFGESNVKEDVFYFSATQSSKCSVLFPNTSLQVIFIWNDEAGKRDLSYILIGGHLQTKNSSAYYSPVELNKWQSRQGIYPGMGLKELIQLNGKPVSFYGWQTEQPGFITTKNEGSLDFKKTGVQLHCLDCNEDRYYTNTALINSANILRENGRVYVSAMVFFPGK